MQQEGFVVKFINTDGMAFIGPGSEWFWTALTMIALTATVIGIYRQLGTQRAAIAVQQLKTFNEEWDCERMRQIRLRLAIALKGGGEDPATWFLLGEVWGFFDRLAVLRREGYLDPNILGENSLGAEVLRWWTVLQDPVSQARSEYGDQEVADFEWLAAEMRSMLARQGVPEFKTDPESVAGRVDWIIEGQSQALRVEGDLKTGLIPADPGIKRPWMNVPN